MSTAIHNVEPRTANELVSLLRHLPWSGGIMLCPEDQGGHLDLAQPIGREHVLLAPASSYLTHYPPHRALRLGLFVDLVPYFQQLLGETALGIKKQPLETMSHTLPGGLGDGLTGEFFQSLHGFGLCFRWLLCDFQTSVGVQDQTFHPFRVFYRQPGRDPATQRFALEVSRLDPHLIHELLHMVYEILDGVVDFRLIREAVTDHIYGIDMELPGQRNDVPAVSFSMAPPFRATR